MRAFLSSFDPLKEKRNPGPCTCFYFLIVGYENGKSVMNFKIFLKIKFFCLGNSLCLVSDHVIYLKMQ